MKKAVQMQKSISRRPLMALVIILFGIGIAMYTNASKNIRREAFGEQDLSFPDMAIIYRSLKGIHDLNLRINESYLNSSKVARQFLDKNYYWSYAKNFSATDNLITAIEKNFPPIVVPPPQAPDMNFNSINLNKNSGGKYDANGNLLPAYVGNNISPMPLAMPVASSPPPPDASVPSTALMPTQK